MSKPRKTCEVQLVAQKNGRMRGAIRLRDMKLALTAKRDKWVLFDFYGKTGVNTIIDGQARPVRMFLRLYVPVAPKRGWREKLVTIPRRLAAT